MNTSTQVSMLRRPPSVVVWAWCLGVVTVFVLGVVVLGAFLYITEDLMGMQ